MTTDRIEAAQVTMLMVESFAATINEWGLHVAEHDSGSTANKLIEAAALLRRLSAQVVELTGERDEAYAKGVWAMRRAACAALENESVRWHEFCRAHKRPYASGTSSDGYTRAEQSTGCMVIVRDLETPECPLMPIEITAANLMVERLTREGDEARAALRNILDAVAHTETTGEICQMSDFSEARTVLGKHQ